MAHDTEYCIKCKRIPLIYEEEIDSGLCEGCIDNAIASYQEREDWNHWHSED